MGRKWITWGDSMKDYHPYLNQSSVEPSEKREFLNTNCLVPDVNQKIDRKRGTEWAVLVMIYALQMSVNATLTDTLYKRIDCSDVSHPNQTLPCDQTSLLFCSTLSSVSYCTSSELFIFDMWIGCWSASSLHCVVFEAVKNIQRIYPMLVTLLWLR